MSLRETMLNATLEHLPLRPLLSADPNTPIREVIRPMRNRAVGCTVILDNQGKPAGIFHEKKLIRLLATNPSALDDPVSMHMIREVVTLPMTARFSVLIQTLRENHLRWVVLVDETGRAVALTGVRGAIEFVVEHFPNVVKVQNLSCRLNLPREGA